MRCPKCGYISFDYNLVCPKCSKDITSVQEQINLPSFKPNPPFLLGALTGETAEPDIGLKMDAVSGEEALEQEVAIDLEGSPETSAEETTDEGLDLDLGLEAEEGEMEEAGAEQEITLDLDEFPDEEPLSEEEPSIES